MCHCLHDNARSRTIPEGPHLVAHRGLGISDNLHPHTYHNPLGAWFQPVLLDQLRQILFVLNGTRNSRSRIHFQTSNRNHHQAIFRVGTPQLISGNMAGKSTRPLVVSARHRTGLHHQTSFRTITEMGVTKYLTSPDRHYLPPR
jgi:hypothetical protein